MFKIQGKVIRYNSITTVVHMVSILQHIVHTCYKKPLYRYMPQTQLHMVEIIVTSK